MRSLAWIVVLAIGAAPLARAQDAPPPNGPRQVDAGWHALVGAKVIVEPGLELDRATIVLRDGVITLVEVDAAPPAGARVHDCTGLTIHAAWIDAHVPVATPVIEQDRPGRNWHAGVTPERSVLSGAVISNELAKELRALGFGAAHAVPDGGVFRGTGAIVALEDVADEHRRQVLAERTFQEVAFETSRGTYPGSLMGVIALMRQSWLDARWDATRRPDGTRTAIPDETAHDSSWAALRTTSATMFVTGDEQDALRALRLAAEFPDLVGKVALVGSGTEFLRLTAIADANVPIVLPLSFPDAPDVSTERERDALTLRQMQLWELAPTNPARLHRAGVAVSLTTDGLDERSEFFANLRSAIRHGMPRDAALAMLTTAPARLFGLDGRLGRIAPGMVANLCVVEGDPFAEDREIRAVWIAGVSHDVEAAPTVALRGEWLARLEFGAVAVDGLSFGSAKKLTLHRADQSIDATRLQHGGRRIDFGFDATAFGGAGTWTATAMVMGDRMHGIGTTGDGERFAWTARRSDAAPGEPAADTPELTDPPEPVAHLIDAPLAVPFGAFGRVTPPAPTDVVVHGVTLWTSGPAGILTDATLVVRDGKVAYAGPSAGAPETTDALVIDGAGRHVTPGLLDCHSHTGITGGVNEGAQAVTSEVRIGDVLDADDINWYRQLAGGLTIANQLHGSANPIGGQNQVVKLRWGVHDPEQMKLDGARPGIKFALGENVKRSRTQDNTRYPNTRMGVEAILRDRFVAAQDYQRELDATASGPAHLRPRPDLELQALAEILRGERLVHCHSYRQDEILMLCRMAGEFGFRIGTLQHGLEGYKVADAIRDHAIGASIFTDWWAYKYEVVDAIPYNAEIMHRVGVVVSFNSDSAELARRMNTEAAKAVKYGGIEPAAALQMVTLNPAKQLAIDGSVGSLEVGKDGDFVIWSGDPLSAFSRCQETWIDGRRQWSEAEDLELRQIASRERSRLLQKLLKVGETRRAAAEPEHTLDNRPGDCECFDRQEVR